MGVITKPSSVQRSVMVRLLVSCGMAAGGGPDRPPAGASRDSIAQTRPSAQGAARAAADPDSAQKTGVCRTGYQTGISRDSTEAKSGRQPERGSPGIAGV